ncbi:MAG TPA: GNAT family N-acetyltransferase [Kofleriaceae bacterium]|jgi:RimJ/RimL family protein N-acetyltransferase
MALQTIAMAPDKLATDRLSGERLRLDHLDPLVNMHRDPRIMATLGGTRSIADSETFVEANLDHWRRNGFGLWIFRRSSDGAFVGRAGLRRVHVGGADEVEVAYVLASEMWGHGLATEIARKLIVIGFGDLQLTTLVAFTLPDHRASIRVMDKAGLRFERAIVHREKPHVLYRINA